MAEHLRCMREEPGPPCGFSPTVLTGILRPTEGREGVVFSPSSIQSCHRRHSLQQGPIDSKTGARVEHDWYVSIEDDYQMYRGDLIHEGLRNEPAPPGTLGVVRELRLATPIETKYGKHRFSGQADEITLLRLEHRTHLVEPDEYILHVRVVDWKSKNDIPHTMLEADRRHVAQINAYAMLVTKEFLHYMQDWKQTGFDEGAYGKAVYYVGSGEEAPVDFDLVTRVVVDEIAINYLSGNKSRIFHSNALLYTRGKQLGEKSMGSDGKEHWHAYRPAQYEELELAHLHFADIAFTERSVRHGMEAQIEAESVLAPPLIEDDAALMCPKCPVRDVCCDIGQAQGYDMRWQRCD